jgi:hypothetical protein
MTEHANVYAALAAAQPEMATIVKGAVNPHFKSKYADLAEVTAAVRPALNKHGLALFRVIVNVPELGTCMRTILAHGASGTTIECDVPLIVARNDMQSFKGACTYAGRIGTESVTGTAPDDDDDGNAAAKAAPKRISSAEMKRQLEMLDHDLADTFSEVALMSLWTQWKAKMDKEGWPMPDDADDETAFRTVVKNKFGDRKREIIATVEAQEIKVPNVLMAGE